MELSLASARGFLIRPLDELLSPSAANLSSVQFPSKSAWLGIQNKVILVSDYEKLFKMSTISETTVLVFVTCPSIALMAAMVSEKIFFLL